MSSESELRETFDRAAAGDAEAAAALFERYYGRVLAIVRKRLGPKLRRYHESGDLVQEAMLHAVRDLGAGDVRDEGAFVAWMAGIVENRLRDMAKYHGAQKRDGARERRAGSLEFEGERDGLDHLYRAMSGDSPVSAAARNEQRAVVTAALDALDPRARSLIELRAAGQSWAQVAQAIEAPSDGAARMSHARAMVQLVRAFERARGEGGEDAERR